MDRNGVAELFSTLTENPIAMLTVVVIIIFFWGITSNGFGTAFRDLPKHLTEAIIATYNFILSLLRREQIDYPPTDDVSKSTSDTKNDSKEQPFKDKIFSLLK